MDRLATETNVSAIAREEKLTRQTVLRIRDKRADCETALTKWEAREEKPQGADRC